MKVRELAAALGVKPSMVYAWRNRRMNPDALPRDANLKTALDWITRNVGRLPSSHKLWAEDKLFLKIDASGQGSEPRKGYSLLTIDELIKEITRGATAWAIAVIAIGDGGREQKFLRIGGAGEETEWICVSSLESYMNIDENKFGDDVFRGWNHLKEKPAWVEITRRAISCAGCVLFGPTIHAGKFPLPSVKRHLFDELHNEYNRIYRLGDFAENVAD